MAHEHDHTIMLTNEDGEEKAFTLICTLEANKQTYAILAEEDTDSAIAMRVEGETDDDMTLAPVEDDAEFALVADVYDKIDPEDLWTDDDEE